MTKTLLRWITLICGSLWIINFGPWINWFQCYYDAPSILYRFPATVILRSTIETCIALLLAGNSLLQRRRDGALPHHRNHLACFSSRNRGGHRTSTLLRSQLQRRNTVITTSTQHLSPFLSSLLPFQQMKTKKKLTHSQWNPEESKW